MALSSFSASSIELSAESNRIKPASREAHSSLKDETKAFRDLQLSNSYKEMKGEKWIVTYSRILDVIDD